MHAFSVCVKKIVRVESLSRVSLFSAYAREGCVIRVGRMYDVVTKLFRGFVQMTFWNLMIQHWFHE